MEENDFNLEEWEKEPSRSDQLFHKGRALYKELLRLKRGGDAILIDSFFAELTPPESESLSHVAELHNDASERVKALLSGGEIGRAWLEISKSPDLFKPELQEIYDLHRITHQQISQANESNPRIIDKNNTSLENDISLSDAFNDWVTAHKKDMAPASLQEYSRMIRQFIQIITYTNSGIEPKVSEITIQMIRDYRKIFEQIPSGVKWDGKTIEQLLKSKGRERSQTTTKNVYGNVGHFINWLEASGYPVIDRAHKTLTNFPKISSKSKKKRVPFDDTDLKALFNSKKYQDGSFTRCAGYWAPLLALFTGGCRNELLQLHNEDIRKVDNIWVIDINDNGEKRLKESSDFDDESSTGRPRLIPIHQKLI